MKTTAIRLYGKKDLRLESFVLPKIKDDQILAEVVTDSLCMSTLKAVNQGSNHTKVPNDIDQNPIIVGHEFCGNILEVGQKWKHKFQPGDKFVIQPNIGHNLCYAPGYSFPFIGGDATYIIIQNEVMQNGSLLKYNGDSFFEGSLVEPLSCVVGAFNANYHLEKMYSHKHIMGIKDGGNMAILGATGPMGFLAIDLAIHGKKKPKKLVITGHTQEKLDLTAKLYSAEEALREGVELYFVNTIDSKNLSEQLKNLIDCPSGFDDVFVFVPNEHLAEEGAKLLAYDGCLNFFAGPSDHNFSPKINLYDIHYKATHIVGTSGGNTADMLEAISLIENKTVNVAKIVSHILGLNDVISSTINLPNLSSGKKIVYTHKKFTLTELSKFNNKTNTFSLQLANLIKKHNGFWNIEAERYFLKHAPEV